jgi:acyl-CoA thioester hydrolase
MKVTLPINVVAFETDYGGVVSNTRYLEYIERGRYALFHAAGFNMEDYTRESGILFVVRKVEIEYLSPARHEDALELQVIVAEHTRTSTKLKFELRRKGEEQLLLRAEQSLVYISQNWRPVRVPQIFRDAFPVEQHMPTTQELAS